MNFSLVFKIEYNDFYDIVKCYFNSFISERSIIPSLSKWFFHYLFVLYDGVIFMNWYISNLLFHLNAFSRIILIKLNMSWGNLTSNCSTKLDLMKNTQWIGLICYLKLLLLCMYSYVFMKFTLPAVDVYTHFQDTIKVTSIYFIN